MFMLLISILLLINLLHIFTTKKSSQNVFLVDFACYKPPESHKCSRETTLSRVTKLGYFSEDVLCFMAKVLPQSGLGDSTYVPETLLSEHPSLTIETARQESEMVIFGAIDSLLAKTDVDCREIGILIVNCSVFNVVPCLASIVVNRYKLREDICSYNLTGMGCSASLLAIGLAKQLLQVHKNTCALIVSTENTTSSLYTGTDPSKFILNCIFRVGGSAILLSNKPSHIQRSKYQLTHSVHTHTASSDVAYKCIFQDEDSRGITGVTTTKDLVVAAAFAIDHHLKTLTFLILPLSELLLFIKCRIVTRLNLAQSQPYVPKFNKFVDHFFPHVGGTPVQDAVQKKLGFEKADMEAARMTLHRFGNTSSSSIWYELAYAEAKGRVKKGDRVWQIAYGSGFKCSSVIWRALRCVEVDEMNPWKSEIDDYPVILDDSGPGSSPYHFDPPK